MILAITLQQTGRTDTGITFSVSGITQDRLTYMWIVQRQEWMTLPDAKSAGYIASYYTFGGDNGTISVNFDVFSVLEYKVWQFIVKNFVDGIETDSSDILNTVLKFEYDNTQTKTAGNTIDITVDDMKRLNLFALYMRSWVLNVESQYYPLDDVLSGDNIAADYLALCGRNILDVASSQSNSTLPNKNEIVSLSSYISDNVISGTEVKAQYFNDICTAINHFNMRC